MSIRAEVDAREVAKVIRVLKTIDKSLALKLSREMKSRIKPIAREVAQKMNSQPAPMSGMANPRWKKHWKPVQPTVRATPGYSWKSPDLVTIDFNKPEAAGIAIAENAGSKTNGNSLRGQLFIRRINQVVPNWPNGGRYLYRSFQPYQIDVYNLGKTILEEWIEEVNEKLESL